MENNLARSHSKKFRTLMQLSIKLVNQIVLLLIGLRAHEMCPHEW